MTAKPRTKIVLRFPELTLTVFVTEVCVRENTLAFRFDPNYFQIDPLLTRQFHIEIEGTRYPVLWAGGYIAFEDSRDHILSFLRVDDDAPEGTS